MIPPEISPETLSDWERRLFEQFKIYLSDDYYVLHSLGEMGHSKKLWAEADFVVIAPDGILVLEIKGGGVSFDDGVWTYIDRNGRKHPGREGPWKQAKEIMFAIKKRIESDQRNRGFPFGFGVVLPDEDFKASSPEINLDILLCKNNWNIGVSKYIRNLELYWEDKNVKSLQGEARTLDKDDRKTIRNILRPNIPTSYTLKSQINNIEKNFIELTQEQKSIQHNMNENPRTFIKGGTGTGKTLLALDKAKDLASSGKRVLFLCFNHLLADSIKENLTEHPEFCENITGFAIHRYFRRVIDNYGNDEKLNVKDISESDLYNILYPEIYSETIMDAKDFEEYDVLIVDEAQDLMTEPLLDAVDLSLKDGLENGKWHMFFDPNQDIFSKQNEKSRNRIDKINPARFSLTKNCRNCEEIVQKTLELSGIEAPSEGSVRGGTTKLIKYKNQSELKSKLESEIKGLLDEGLTPNDFIVLSTRKLENSVLSEIDSIANYPLIDIRKNAQMDSNKKDAIDFCTMHAFKGLERRAVIAVDVEKPETEYHQKLLYSGLSRAKCYLAVIMQS